MYVCIYNTGQQVVRRDLKEGVKYWPGGRGSKCKCTIPVFCLTKAKQENANLTSDIVYELVKYRVVVSER